MSESDIQKEILDFFNDQPKTKAINIHGNRFQQSGTPDIIGCHWGQMFCLEVKSPDSSHKLEELQGYRIRQWEDAGADCFVVESVEEVEKMFS